MSAESNVHLNGTVHTSLVRVYTHSELSLSHSLTPISTQAIEGNFALRGDALSFAFQSSLIKNKFSAWSMVGFYKDTGRFSRFGSVGK